MGRRYRSSLESYRAEATEAAKDLYYGTAVIERIKNAKTDREIQRIMITARHEQMERENKLYGKRKKV